MGIIGIGIMWAFAFAVYVIISKWPMGTVGDQRTAYWSKHENKQ